MIVSFVKIIGSIFLLVATLASVQAATRVVSLRPEAQRKAIHASLGIYALTFPVIFSESWEVIALCSLAIFTLLVIRSRPALKQKLGASLYSVERLSWGEILFALSIGLLFYLSDGNAVLYVIPILILTLCDAVAALVGTEYAKSFFVVEDGKKSLEGTTLFFLTAWILSMVALLLLSDIPRASVISAALIIAVFGALIEAVSWKGLDNLLVPVGLFLLLQRVAFLPPDQLGVVSISFLVVLITSTWIAKRLKFDVHAINTVVIAAFFCWIVGGWSNVIGPFAVFATYLYLQRTEKLSDDLPLVLCIIGTALYWFIISSIFNYNTYYVYDLSFSLHLTIYALLQNKTRRIVSFFFVVIGSWMIVNLRLLFSPYFPTFDTQLSLSALILILITASIIIAANQLFQDRRWTKQALLAMIIASFGIPVTL